MRVTSPAVTIKTIWDALVADYGAAGTYALLLETQLDAPVSGAKADLTVLEAAVALNLDSKVSLAKADLTNLETRLSAARAGYLDELAAGNIPTDLSNLVTNYLGDATHGLAALETLIDDLETRISAVRAGYLDNLNNANLGTIADISTLTATIIGYINNVNLGTISDISSLNVTRIGYLDQLDFNLNEAIAAIPTTMVGTNGAALASAYTAARAASLEFMGRAFEGYTPTVGVASDNDANYVTVLEVASGRGIFVGCGGHSEGAYDLDLKLTIDAQVIVNGEAMTRNGTYSMLGMMAFDTSLLVEMKLTAAGGADYWAVANVE